MRTSGTNAHLYVGQDRISSREDGKGRRNARERSEGGGARGATSAGGIRRSGFAGERAIHEEIHGAGRPQRVYHCEGESVIVSVWYVYDIARVISRRSADVTHRKSTQNYALVSFPRCISIFSFRVALLASFLLARSKVMDFTFETVRRRRESHKNGGKAAEWL